MYHVSYIMDSEMEITEVRIYPFDTTSYGGKTKAFAEITLNGTLTIRGLRVIESKSGGLFVSYPSQVGREGKPRSLVIFTDNKLREQIRRVVIDAYREQEGI
jgi:stage V sporulation protein G